MESSRLVTAAVAIFGAVTLFGCATIFKGSTQDMSVKSSPAKASFVVKTTGGVEIAAGATPAVVKLAKKHEYTVTVKLAGYKESTVAITQSLEGWFWGNLICGGVVGMVIDYASGAMWDLEPDQVMVSLVTASVENQPSRLYAVFRAYDDQGQLKTMVVPLIKNNDVVYQGK